MNTQFSRRQILAGASSVITLPYMSSLFAATVAAPVPPRRLVFLNTGFGVSKEFFPNVADTGKSYALPKAMEALTKHREHFSFLSNLSNIASLRVNPHWGATTFLTSSDPQPILGQGFHNSISCDQVAAQFIGKTNRYPSIELTTSDTAGKGKGLSLAWDANGESLYGEADPLKIFHRLFASQSSSIDSTRNKIRRERSILDATLLDAKSLSNQLNTNDKAKTEQYFSLIRKIEKNLAREEQWMNSPKPKAPFAAPASGLTGTPGALMMFDLMTAALQSDTTRVFTYQLPLASLLDEFAQETGDSVAAHRMTHYGSTETKEYQALLWRDKKLCQLFAALIDKLNKVIEVDGSTLLDNTLIVMGSDIRTGHMRKNVPILLAGGRAGKIQQGQHLAYRQNESRLSDLWLSMLHFAGCPVEKFADSTGGFSNLFI